MSPFGSSDRATLGAVYVEFLAAFMPLFTFFLGLVQLMFVHAASIITSHSAIAAARAAAVVLPDHPKYYGGTSVNAYAGGRQADIERAAKIPLSALGTDPSSVSVTLDSGSYGRNQLITVTVEHSYACKVPLGNLIACGGTEKTLKATASMPNQGADYPY